MSNKASPRSLNFIIIVHFPSKKTCLFERPKFSIITFIKIFSVDKVKENIYKSMAVGGYKEGLYHDRKEELLQSYDYLQT